MADQLLISEMAVRYTPDELKFLRDSPLVVRPPGLPPAEQWMGQPAETTRNSTKLATDRAKNHDSNTVLDPSRRPLPERHVSRNSANPEDLTFAPPSRNLFPSSIRNPSKNLDSPDRPSLRETESKERFSFRSKAAEIENDRKDNRTLRPRQADGEESDGGGKWSTVKPRKSFGTEGAERFNGRMGLDRHRDDRRFKEREEREVKERPREFDRFARDKDVDREQDQDREARRNGTGRGRNEPTWFKDKENNDGPPTQRDRNNGDRTADRSRGWREKDREDRGDRGDRGGDRGDRRWDRENRGEHRQEREPEWMDEPAPKESHAHTQEEFQKWKEQMQGKDKAVKAGGEEAPPKLDTAGSFFALEKPKVETPLGIDTGPDKFFGMWGTPKGETPTESVVESRKEGIAKATTVGKASRFTSFFSPQEDSSRRTTDPPPGLPQNQPPAPTGNLLDMFQGAAGGQQNTSQAAEKEAFQALLQKLQRQAPGANGSNSPVNNIQQSQPEKLRSNPVSPPDQFQQYRLERPDDGRSGVRSSQMLQQQQQQQALQDILNSRQMSNSQPTIRPEQMLQDLVGQRQNTLSQASARQEQQNRNTNTEFLMGLMQSAKAAPEPQRSEQVLLRMQQNQMGAIDRQMAHQIREREEMQREAAAQAQAQRERSASQRQARPPPGFYDEAAAFQRGPPQHERQSNPPQPTQILQRPPPPGLDLGWDRQAQLPPQHRLAQNIAPPPGLPNGPQRGMQPMPQQMFPPGFMGNFPAEIMAGPPGARGMQMPPPGFFNAPPPGFLPPGMAGFNVPDFGPSPYDGRGPPPNGGFQRRQ